MATRPQAQPTVQVDNERVLVTEWRFAPGAETTWHRHGYDYVVVPMTTGKLQLEDGHNVINANEYEFVFVEIEFKAPQ